MIICRYTEKLALCCFAETGVNTTFLLNVSNKCKVVLCTGKVFALPFDSIKFVTLYLPDLAQ